MKLVYNKPLTILNKLKASDTLSKQDLWFKHIIHDGAWYITNESSVSGTTVSMSSKITVLIPYNEMYLPYKEWKLETNILKYFTMSNGDYIINGVLEDEINSQTITKTLSRYEPDVCSVKSINVLPRRGIETVMLKIEGV